MGRNIICAGAGHGGLVSAIKLAKSGFNVKVFERLPKNSVGWDWTDDFDLEVFEKCSLENPKPEEFFRMGNFNYFSPDKKTKIPTNVPMHLRKIVMDRKTLISKLIDYAENAGVQLFFNRRVESPLIENDEVIGLVIKDLENGTKFEEKADLVIDAAGIDSPVRIKLPKSYNIRPDYKRGECFYAYRAFFNATDPEKIRSLDDVFFYMNEDRRGINWVRNILGAVDVLIGRIDPINEEYVQSILNEIKYMYPFIGNVVVRGGQYAKIPLRRCLDKIVGERYAAVGDSAFMTIPLIGSGITASMMAGNILAEVILEIDRKYGESGRKESISPYTNAELWKYQVRYYKEINSGLAGIQLMKDFMLTAKPSDINFLFDHRIIKARDFEASALGKQINIPFVDLIGRILRGFAKIDILLEIKGITARSQDVQSICKQIPTQYNYQTWKQWAIKYNSQFRSYELKIRRDRNL